MSKILTDNKFNEMMKHPDRTNWARVLKCFKCTQEQFRKNRESRRDLFSNEKLRTNPDKRDWGFTLQWFEMDESILREFIDYISNWKITNWQKVSRDFLREFKDKLIMEDFEE